MTKTKLGIILLVMLLMGNMIYGTIGTEGRVTQIKEMVPKES